MKKAMKPTPPSNQTSHIPARSALMSPSPPRAPPKVMQDGFLLIPALVSGTETPKRAGLALSTSFP